MTYLTENETEFMVLKTIPEKEKFMSRNLEKDFTTNNNWKTRGCTMVRWR